MAPFTHHQWLCLPGSPTHVMIQRHLQLSLLQHRTDGFDVDLSCALVVKFLPWSISAGDGSPIPIRVVLKSAKTS